MMRAVHGSTVLYPCCANATAHLVAEMVGRPGIHYLRTTRGKTPVLYGPTEPFPIGGSKLLRASDRDAVAIIAAGVTVPQALRAHEELATRGIDPKAASGTRSRRHSTGKLRPGCCGSPSARCQALRLRTSNSSLPESGRRRSSAVEKLVSGAPRTERTLDRLVDEESVESFPASDPPTWTPMHAGGPSRQDPAMPRSSRSHVDRHGARKRR